MITRSINSHYITIQLILNRNQGAGGFGEWADVLWGMRDVGGGNIRVRVERCVTPGRDV